MPGLAENYRNVVVVGASAGGVEAIMEMVKGFPDDLPDAVFIVQHIPAYAQSRLDHILQPHTRLKVKSAIDGEEIRAGTIYIAVSDRHLLVENDRVVVSRGPRENRFRPAVDALFRSAAQSYGERVIGVVLSGALNDGTSGMWTIKRANGTAIVQDPEEAMFSDMPRGVMQYTKVDHVLPVGQIGSVLATLSRTQIKRSPAQPGKLSDKLLEIELEIAKGNNGLRLGILDEGKPTALACPECHGALTQFEEGKLIRFRCHTGHAHTAESLLASVSDNVEKSMWEMMRGMEETRILLMKMAEKLEEGHQEHMAELYRSRADAIQDQAVAVQQMINQENLSGIDPVQVAGNGQSYSI